MIGVATNVVLRVRCNDDPEQVARTLRLLGSVPDGGEFVGIAVVSQAARVARRQTDMDRDKFARVIEFLVETREFEIGENAGVVWTVDYLRAGPANFKDYFIAEINNEVGCSATDTVNSDTSKSPGFTLVPA